MFQKWFCYGFVLKLLEEGVKEFVFPLVLHDLKLFHDISSHCGFEAANETEIFSVHLRTDGLAAGWHYRQKRAQVCQLKPFGLHRSSQNPCGVK